MKYIKRFYFMIFLFFSLLVFSQEISNNKFIRTLILKEIQLKKEIDFKKACSFFIQNNLDSTLVYTAKQLSNKNNTLEIKDFCHYFRARCFIEKKIYDVAKLELNKTSNQVEFHYHIVILLGEIALEQQDYKIAIDYFETVEREFIEKHDFNRYYFYQNLGLCYFHTEKFNKAEEYLFRASNFLSEEADTIKTIRLNINIANLYYEQYKDNQAIPYFEKAYALSKKIKNFEIKQNAALNMAVVEENRKDLVKAMMYRKEYDIWKDSLNNQNKIWAVAEIEKKYAVDQKQKEIQLLASENKTKVSQRNGFIVASVLFLLLFGTAFYFYNQKRKTNKIINAQKENLDALNATKDKLFSIVSHDLRSSVNTMQVTNTKLLKDIANRNYDTLDKTAHKNAAIANSTFNLLENLLHWATLQTQQLYFHIETVDLFSVMQQIEYNYKPLFENKNLVFANKIPKATFVLADLDSLKIIIRNLLDNAIKFSNENDTISVYTFDKEAIFHYLVIEDTGIGMDEETRIILLKEGNLLNKKKNQKGIGTGLGLQLCKSMIQKNKGTLAIESTEGKGTKIIIALPKFASNG
jgi:signal transduction histidine kinase